MPASPTPRMQQLRQMIEREPDDPFLLYGLALEHKKIGDSAEAIALLDRVIQLDPGYCYAFHQKGLVYESIGDLGRAKQTYRQGIDAARRKGDAHAAGEIEAALIMLE